MISLNSKRLIISTMTKEEMIDLIESYRESAPELSIAYREMLDGCIGDPDHYAWYCAWKIVSIEGHKQIGEACFKGFNNGSPEIGYGIHDDCTGMGYATEAVTALCKWALSIPEILSIEAETEEDNDKSKRVLAKAGFIPTGKTGDEGPRYILMDKNHLLKKVE